LRAFTRPSRAPRRIATRSRDRSPAGAPDPPLECQQRTRNQQEKRRPFRPFHTPRQVDGGGNESIDLRIDLLEGCGIGRAEIGSAGPLGDLTKELLVETDLKLDIAEPRRSRGDG